MLPVILLDYLSWGNQQIMVEKFKTKPSLFLTRNLPGNGVEKLSEYFDVSVNPEDRVLEKNEIISHIRDKEALLCLLTDTIDKDVIQAAPRLKVISNYAVGFNNIDIIEATHRKIPVCITPGILTDTTADLTWALILAVTRRIIEADAFTRNGLFTGWSPSLFLGLDVSQKTLGIVGLGRIGAAVAKRASGFDMKVIYSSRSKKEMVGAEQVSLETLLKTADIISLHVPLTKETHHLIDEHQFQLMKKTAYLINTTRGAVVKESALLNALKKGEILGAGLDVYENEPQILEGLTALPNVVLLPHIGSATYETRTKMALLAADNAIAIIKGQKPHAIANPEVL